MPAPLSDFTDPQKDAADMHCESHTKTRHAAIEEYAAQLARIESALTRMELGCYGVCTCCEENISLSRLKADPATATCQNCKEPENLTA